ncbi:hypothetical protein CR205_11185 [Alteribacter lacisalsi]|uniref:Uncharacterized protein n=1 Tax=Alteribacter lacisalsi TaxID=2045244 RepID=A0A2W0HGQ1_9BACI|nr:hypothetical protein [Alteribacter lacisalsi]PYZ99090.1 hypothetical protein CR205_11185 [Alteribacter lacisalsi]
MTSAMTNISKGYKELRKKEQEPKKEKKETIQMSGGNENMTQEEQIQLLTKAVADLHEQLNGKQEEAFEEETEAPEADQKGGAE